MTFIMTSKNRTITVYNLRADTREFIGQGDALIPAFTGLPAHCTTAKPPEAAAGFIPVFDSETQSWQLTEDHRGEVVYSTTTGRQQYITEPGAYPPETTPVAPDTAWQKWDGSQWVVDAQAEHAAQVSEAQGMKNGQMKQAGDVIATLQDAVDFEMATEEETASLMAWKKYRVLLSRVDPEMAPDIVWPEMP
ncbi:tail fiber assembly protein [Buttiauxella agrestis]